jgi:surface antigen
MNVVQTKLTRRTPSGTSNLVAWLPEKPNVRVGSVVSLDGSDERWRVSEQWCRQDSSLINQKWGLELPKTQRTER